MKTGRDHIASLRDGRTIYLDGACVDDPAGHPAYRGAIDSIAGDNIEMCQKQFHATPAHVYQNYQSQIRLAVKVRFLLGIAQRIAETNGITGFPQVREMLGQLAAEAAMVEAFVTAMETKGTQHGAYFVPDRQKTQQSPAANAADKVKFYKLARDAVGSEFASRHVQYEMFYAGATFVTKGHSLRTYDWKGAAGLLDRMLASYQLADELAGAPDDKAAMG